MSDPFFNDVSLLLPFRDGLYDLSPKRNIITSEGITLSSAQSKFYGKSAYFYSYPYLLRISGTCIYGTTATVETWVNTNNLSSMQCMFSSGDGIRLYILPTGAIHTLCGSYPPVTTADGVVSVNSWVHVAVVITPSSVSVFINGIKTATSTDQDIVNIVYSDIVIGQRPNNSAYTFSGYLQDFRITLAERYTADFTPPEALYDAGLVPNGNLTLSYMYLSTWDGTIHHAITRPDCDQPFLSGNYRITGIVKELGKAGRYKVRLFDKHTAQCTRETWSKSDGSYVFDNIADTEYFVVAYDHGASPKNAQIFDFVRPSQRF